MRLTRHLPAVATAATAATAALAALILAAGPAVAVTTPDPDIRGFLTGPTCSGDTLSGWVRVASDTATEAPGTIELRYNSGGRVYPATGIVRPFTVRGKGSRDYSFSFNLAALPAGTTQLRTYAVVGDPASPTDTQLSKVVLTSSCAPAEVIPEAPTAALVPLTLLGTAAVVLVVRRRRLATVQPPA